MTPIAVHHIWKSYGPQTVLRDVSVEAADAVTCVMAPSGRGKTTLLRIFLGLETPDRGTVETPPGCRWAAVFQENRLLEDLDARGNLRFVLGREYDETRAWSLLTELGLGETAGQAVREFSGGMKRRLALARALLAPADALARLSCKGGEGDRGDGGIKVQLEKPPVHRHNHNERQHRDK